MIQHTVGYDLNFVTYENMNNISSRIKVTYQTDSMRKLSFTIHCFSNLSPILYADCRI